ncbi:hypothetical protein BC749_102846 [Flavobacterium araucananum]|jgi:hypothetical protein|uniref:Uncharacterized protein n=1 Tax=Flavobacterium araucananum TaxID=946678 RepID=A0A227P2P6_9FLAO|nr:hypothetical protein [Flavobacterium araucananum]OXG04161.1 hypothetical protein B0A64_16005 [Flavobacterium araucananum]PWK01270.1 hypothetical protein BC749_102846 [Flavobacterium araucananum]
MKILRIFNTLNEIVISANLENNFNIYSKLKIDPKLKEVIKQRIYSEKKFEIDVEILQILIPALNKRIEELLKHSDFNPFKEELRERFPEQYANEPFVYEGITYYLYNKGSEFYIDSLIHSTSFFKELLEQHVKINKPLKYFYKEI